MRGQYAERMGTEGEIVLTRQRIDWLDVLKCIGMFEIFIGHISASGEGWINLVFSSHVPLFFLMSGFTESFHETCGFLETAKNKTIKILIPFYFFCLLSIIVFALDDPLLNASGIRTLLYTVFIEGAIRNHGLGSVWFLSCLWSTSLLFYLFRVLLRKKVLIVLAAALCFYCANTLITPASSPSWVYNVDSALYYLIFYALGFVAFPYINKYFSLFGKCPRLTVVGIVVAFCCFVYTVLVYFGYRPLSFIGRIPVLGVYYFVVSALILITFCVFLSYLMRKLFPLQRIGRATLYLCGSETAVKLCVVSALSAVGVSLDLTTPLQSFLYAGALMVGITYLLTPLEKRAINAICMLSCFAKQLIKPDREVRD